MIKCPTCQTEIPALMVISEAAGIAGRKGGKVMSAKKLRALKRNARRPRPGARKNQLPQSE